jgi:hypothetical protein
VSVSHEEPWWAMKRDAYVRARVSYVDAQGVTWQVSERECSDAPGARGEYCLVFDSGEVLRRVWDYPEHWHTLSALALAELSWRR